MSQDLSPLAQRIVNILRNKGPMSAGEITTTLEAKSSTIRHHLYFLNKMGRIEHVGQLHARWGENAGKWKVKEEREIEGQPAP